MPFEPSFTDVEFWALFKKFNAIFGELSNWRIHTARKIQTDEFNIDIQPGEDYFGRAFGNSWTDQFKLARQSMELILMTLFTNNPTLELLASKLEEMQFQKLQDAVNRAFDPKPED